MSDRKDQNYPHLAKQITLMSVGESAIGRFDVVKPDGLVVVFDDVTATLELAEQEFLNQLPEWAIGRADGQYVPGAQLPTRDGRRIGNAHIVAVIGCDYCDPIIPSITLFHVLTDAGTELRMTADELIEYFYPPEYVSDVMQVRAKFSRSEEPK